MEATVFKEKALNNEGKSSFAGFGMALMKTQQT